MFVSDMLFPGIRVTTVQVLEVQRFLGLGDLEMLGMRQAQGNLKPGIKATVRVT